jgi:ketosteroid isomerase-like protein
MSRENVEVVCAVYEAFNRRDFDHIANYAHPDFEIQPLPALIAMTGDRIKGYEEAKRFWSSFFEGFDEIQVEPRKIVEAGDKVVAALRWRGRGRDGIEVDQFHTDLWFFRDGRITRVEGFATEEEALAAAGLRE